MTPKQRIREFLSGKFGMKRCHEVKEEEEVESTRFNFADSAVTRGDLKASTPTKVINFPRGANTVRQLNLTHPLFLWDMTDIHTGDSQETLAVWSLDKAAGIEHEQTNMESQGVVPAQASRLSFFMGIVPRLHFRQAIALPQSEDEEDSETRRNRIFRQRRKRIIFSCIVLVIVLLVAILPQAIVHAVRRRQYFRRPMTQIGVPSPRSCTQSVPWHFGAHTSPKPASFLGSTYQYTATATIPLSASADVLDLVTQEYQTHYLHGSVEFLIDDGRKYSGSRDVHVEVTAFVDDREDLRHSTMLCQLRSAPESEGAALIMHDPRYRGRRSRRMAFSVKVVFPSSEGSPLHIKRFQTNMPRFIHNVGDLHDRLFFQHILLRTVDEPVHSLGGEMIRITTANGLIKGSLDAKSSLSLHTQNAPIEVDARVMASDAAKRSVVSIQTTNAHISANVSLLAQHDSATFTTFFATTNAALDIAIPAIPLGSLVDMRACTLNAPATVRMPKTFHGHFDLASLDWHPPRVHFDASAEDPEHRRQVEIRPQSGDSYVQGNIYLVGHEKPRMGGTAIHVMASNSEVDLFL
ncbi:uncharacterized protein FIBRA_03041 [Fibroporia radiculosa]|uniref:Uncharacterized protein n=1 Tax=Fibroporia radiculosa TaxID=599839 RepID=J4G3X0_9APHY|nr:uncharacterized protein FIBRA_03041 [Fibroporia radiculosa]CCM00993.1 predicted protein [Fibroporia radiculosa]